MIEYEMVETPALGRIDERHLPEEHRFAADQGCFVAPLCKRCPLPECLTALPLRVRLLAIEIAGRPAELFLKNSLR